ncbi:hypothetical protein JJB09_25550 [Rhizobium sp. KVB221]|uniref:Uncharacterized protein n=1 Tax=Rhizobium setariae TaxID=2801340 RepID=A0A937CPW1_9HYPH|nr:hypothetical protein [Rhizobium setariae]MBL0375381.1 hypothetical protein [Rhizobium setariae]
MIRIEDVDIRCRDGWIPIIMRMVDELNAASLRMTGILCREAHGRLRVDYVERSEIFRAIGKVVVRAEFRSMYVCGACGAPGEHRRGKYGCLSTRCWAHQDLEARAGTVRYDTHRKPWRRMRDGDWQYDPVADDLIRMTGRLHDRYPHCFGLSPSIALDPVTDVLRRIGELPIAAAYRISGLSRDVRGHLVIGDNIYTLPAGPQRDLLMAMFAGADDRVSRLPTSVIT